jgi:hypothetical protein
MSKQSKGEECLTTSQYCLHQDVTLLLTVSFAVKQLRSLIALILGLENGHRGRVLNPECVQYSRHDPYVLYVLRCFIRPRCFILRSGAFFCSAILYLIC